jgi:hypothetical protein
MRITAYCHNSRRNHRLCFGLRRLAVALAFGSEQGTAAVGRPSEAIPSS